MPEIVDAYTHILPPRYEDALLMTLPGDSPWRARMATYHRMLDDDRQAKRSDVPGYSQVICLLSPPVDTVFDPRAAVTIAQQANDAMAELVRNHPDRYQAAVAALPMNNVPEAMKEADRCLDELGMKGVLLYTPSNGKPLDAPELLPLYEKMVEHDSPLWIHPGRDSAPGDYAGEATSRYDVWFKFGWPVDTTIAMNRLVYSGVLEKYPTLRFIVHHGGGMIPFFEQRISPRIDPRDLTHAHAQLTRPPSEYFKMFYADVANLSAGAVKLAYEFFGPDHLVFGTDYPYGPGLDTDLRNVQTAVDGQDHLAKILAGNAKRLLHIR